MKPFKKIISMLLAATVVAGTASLTFAKSYDDIKENDPHSDEVEILSDLGVILGTSENEFSPDKNVTREQMAAMLFRLMLGRDDAGRVNTTKFIDLYEPYYNGAISWATAAGHIKGVSATRFNPAGGITKQDAMTMLVRALGQSNDKMNDGYPWSYISEAARLGLDRGLEDVAYTDVLTRAETAQIIYNALVSDYIVTKNQNGTIIQTTTSIIESVFGYTIAEAQLIATNSSAIIGEKVVKNGYVSMLANDGGKEFMMTVPAESLHMDGDANENLGRTFKVIYRAENGRYSVLSSVRVTDSEVYEAAVVNKNGTVSIGEHTFTLVPALSDELQTNNDEIMLYSIGNDGTAELVTDPEKLDGMLGFYRIELMNNNGKIDTAIIKTYSMDTFKIDKNGGFNIADGKGEDEITAKMPEVIKNGDVVLYRYNESAKELEVLKVLDRVNGTVMRLTNDSVKIGDDTFSIGNERAGITAESIRSALALGNDVTAVIHDGAVVAVIEKSSVIENGKYLVALSDAHLVYENGAFRYVMSAYIDGQTVNVYLANSNAEAGKVYRYTESNGIVTIVAPASSDNTIISGAGQFIQNENELGFIVNNASNTTIEMNGKSSYTLSAGDGEYASSNGEDNVKFVTDERSVIIVRDGDTMKTINGKYASTVTVSDGAAVVAVFENEVGAVETLRYLYISAGSLGNYDRDGSTVRILAKNGMAFISGAVYTEYTVYDFSDNSVKAMVSKSGELEIGGDYRIGGDGTITTDAAEEMKSGKIDGYTSETVTIGAKTYSVDENVTIVVIGNDGKLSTKTIAELYEKDVEFIENNESIRFILVDETKVNEQ